MSNKTDNETKESIHETWGCTIMVIAICAAIVLIVWITQP